MPVLKFCAECCFDTPHDLNGNCLTCWTKKIKAVMSSKVEPVIEKPKMEEIKMGTKINFRVTINQNGKVYEYARFCSNFKELQDLINVIKKDHWDVEQ